MAIPGFPEAASGKPPAVAGTSQPSAFSEALGRTVSSAPQAIESVANRVAGFNIRDDAAAIFGRKDGAGDLVGQVAGKVRKRPLREPASTQEQRQSWGALSRHLFANLFPVDSSGASLGGHPINAPASDVQFQMTLNWQSPFENMGPESKAPTLMALLQTGQVSTVANALSAFFPEGEAGDFLRQLAGTASDIAKDLEGRTSITKLNSRQVFSGMPPIKISMTIHLRAVANADREVMDPYRRLLEWALPQSLAKDGLLPEIASGAQKSAADAVKALFPSLAPTMVGLTYGNNRYSPMVIEDVSHPLDGPMGENGLPLYRAVQLQLATLTALDRGDVATLFRSRA